MFYSSFHLLLLDEGFNNYEYFNKRTIQVRQLTVTQELYMLKMSCISVKMIMKELCSQLFGTFNCSQLFGVFIINLSKKMHHASSSSIYIAGAPLGFRIDGFEPAQ